MATQQDTRGSDLMLRREHFPAALAALAALAPADQAVDEDYLPDALEALDWGVRTDGDGNIVALFYNEQDGNYEREGDDLPLYAIAPWVETGGFVAMENETGASWGCLFVDGAMIVTDEVTCAFPGAPGAWRLARIERDFRGPSLSAEDAARHAAASVTEAISYVWRASGSRLVAVGLCLGALRKMLTELRS